MSSFWKFVSDHWWWLIILASAGGAEWAAARFDAGISALVRRSRRSMKRRDELRDLRIEARKRQLDATHPLPVKPICGCGHDLAFHNIETNACHHIDGDRRCTCQRYIGPELLGQIYLPPLVDPKHDTA